MKMKIFLWLAFQNKQQTGVEMKKETGKATETV
jgi:hypothetical protein